MSPRKLEIPRNIHAKMGSIEDSNSMDLQKQKILRRDGKNILIKSDGKNILIKSDQSFNCVQLFATP